MSAERYNAVVIGAGTAGLVTAAATAGLGGRVALIERKHMGGDCLNFGCVPSKALIASARAADRIRHADRWGLEAREPAFAFERVMERMRARRAHIAPNDSQERFEKLGVEVNARLQTSQPHIYAAGDIAGPYRFTHMADYQARIVARNMLVPFGFLRSKTDYATVPWCTYLEPEVARVGLNETEANERGVEYDLFTSQLADLDRAVVEDETSGVVKVLTARGTDRILGVTLVSAHAGDLIHEFVLAMRCGIGLGRISGVIHAYPTFAELARKTGDAYQKTRLTPFAKKLFRWLYERGRRS